jgi:Ca-activated chloride channel family protein
MEKPLDHYASLGLSRSATPEEIAAACQAAASQLKTTGKTSGESRRRLRELQETYAVLMDPAKRAAYDASLPTASQPPISIIPTYTRPLLPRLPEPQLIYLLLDIMSLPERTSGPAPPLNICLVLDRSTSMQGKYMDTVKNAAIELLRQLQPKDIISIVAFSDRAEVIIPAASKQDRSKLETSIQMLLTGGGTELYHGLASGVHEIRRNLSAAAVNHLILMTDGHTYGDEENCLRLADEAALLGIGLTCLGIGNEWNDIFLDILATRMGGTSQFVNHPGDIEHLLKQKFATLAQVFGERLTLLFDTGSYALLTYAFRLEPETGVLPTISPLRLGSLAKDSLMRILLEFLVAPIPPEETDVTLIEGQLDLTLPSQKVSRVCLPFTFKQPITQQMDLDPPHDAIVQAIGQLSLYRLQEKARQEVDAGDVANATRHLNYLATNLMARGEQQLANTVLIESERLQRTRTLSAEGQKLIKYGTRALVMSKAS